MLKFDVKKKSTLEKKFNGKKFEKNFDMSAPSEEKIKKGGVTIYEFSVLIYESLRYTRLSEW